MPPAKTFGAIHVSFVPDLGIRGLVMSLNPNTSNRNQDQLHPWTIRHDSLFKAVWDWIILILVMYTAIEIPFSVTFVLTLQDEVNWFWEGITVAHICNLIVDLMFIIDIVINFRSTYVEDETDEIVSNPRKVACHYLKSWFVVDFVAAIPFDYIFSFQATKGGGHKATMLMGLLKTARLLRLVRVARKLDRYSEYGTAVVILLTCLFTLVAHWLACIWHYIGYTERSDQFGWLNKLAMELELPPNNTDGADIQTRYITALYFTLSSLTSVGFGNVSPNTDAEKIFSISVMIIGALMYASIFGNLTAIIQRLYSRSSHYHRRLRLIEEFVKFHKVPKSLREEMEEYFRHEWACTNGVDMENVLERFPESLRADICLHLHQNLFSECPTFKSASEGCMRALAVRFKVFHYLPGHCIIKQGDEVNKLYFICKGVVEVVKDGETVLTLGKGDTISCDYSTAQSQHIPQADASLRFQTHGVIHSVAWSDLFVVLKAYPDFKEDFLGRLEIAYNLGQLDEDREVSQFTSVSGPGPRRLSNARSNLSATPVLFDSCEHSGSPTLMINGRVTQNRTEVLVQQVPRGSDPKLQSISTQSAGPSSFTCDQEFWQVERRLNRIEENLSVMESKFTRTFEEILRVLHHKKSSEEDHNPDHRTTNV